MCAACCSLSAVCCFALYVVLVKCVLCVVCGASVAVFCVVCNVLFVGGRWLYVAWCCVVILLCVVWRVLCGV